MGERLLAFTIAAIAAGCTSAPEESPPPAPEVPSPFAAITPPAALQEPPPERELCPALAGLIAKEPQGFARLRGEPLARERWRARETLPGTERCTIEGEAWPRARYLCAGEAFAPESEAFVQIRFENLAEEIDRCLDKPIWFPRAWRKGELMQFAMGERMQTWLDQSTSPPTAVPTSRPRPSATRRPNSSSALEKWETWRSWIS